MADTVERTATRIQGFASGEYDFQLMRLLGAGNYGGGTPGEVFAARAAISGDDPAQWPAAFVSLASEVDALGAAADPEFPVSARDHALRASMYWRCAEYFADPFEPQQREWGLASRASFRRAAAHFQTPFEPMPYPCDGLELPGYFLRPAGADPAVPRPTVLTITGFDGTGEELYFQTARAALERGFNVAVAEGPGQVGALRDHPDLVFRPDYEVPIRAMVDTVLARSGVDPQRLALYGISFGGYFALRGAAHDDRIRALIANSPIVDLHAYMSAFVGGHNPDDDDFSLDDLPHIPDEVFPRLNKLMFKASCRRFGVRTFSGWFERIREFSAVSMLADIQCPTLALAGTGEGNETERQLQQFADQAGGPVTVHRFASLGSDMHCQLGNLPLSNAVIFDWLGRLWRAPA